MNVSMLEVLGEIANTHPQFAEVLDSLASIRVE